MKPKLEQRMRQHYPPISPTMTGRLAVSDRHTLYYEECGNPGGKPVIILHGGPGAGCNPTMRRYHDPARYRVILFDQRGCGRSEPHAELAENTTWDLVADIEKLRTHLNIGSWQVFGGSWGSTLAMAYAETHPDRVSEMVLRGIFFATREDIEWFYRDGASILFPDEYEKFLAPLAREDHNDPIPAYYRLLTGDDQEAKEAAARAWSMWEGATLSVVPNPDRVKAFGAARYAIAFARIECHYFINEGFVSGERDLLRNIERIAHIPTTIINGRYDVVTPMRSAWRLHKALPKSELVIVPDAGHAMSEPGLVDALIRATDRFGE